MNTPFQRYDYVRDPELGGCLVTDIVLHGEEDFAVLIDINGTIKETPTKDLELWYRPQTRYAETITMFTHVYPTQESK
jgi:hypothetical protein